MRGQGYGELRLLGGQALATIRGIQRPHHGTKGAQEQQNRLQAAWLKLKSQTQMQATRTVEYRGQINQMLNQKMNRRLTWIQKCPLGKRVPRQGM